MSAAAASDSPKGPLTVIFDGGRPENREEMEHLKSKDSDGRLTLVDVSQTDFNPADYSLTEAESRQSVHARDASGRLLSGSAALEAAHEAVGLGSYFRFTRSPGLTGSGSGFRG